MLNEIRLVPKGNQLLMVGLSWDNQPLLKARLAVPAGHPRALITVLEGFALWSGRRLPVAVGVGARSMSCIEELLPDGPAWASPLVEIHVVDHPRPRRKVRLDGVGDLREAFQLRLPVIS